MVTGMWQMSRYQVELASEQYYMPSSPRSPRQSILEGNLFYFVYLFQEYAHSLYLHRWCRHASTIQSLKSWCVWYTCKFICLIFVVTVVSHIGSAYQWWISYFHHLFGRFIQATEWLVTFRVPAWLDVHAFKSGYTWQKGRHSFRSIACDLLWPCR